MAQRNATFVLALTLLHGLVQLVASPRIANGANGETATVGDCRLRDCRIKRAKGHEVNCDNRSPTTYLSRDVRKHCLGDGNTAKTEQHTMSVDVVHRAERALLPRMVRHVPKTRTQVLRKVRACLLIEHIKHLLRNASRLRPRSSASNNTGCFRADYAGKSDRRRVLSAKHKPAPEG